MQASIPAKPGQPERYDYEYEREGVANLFMFVEPLAGKRHVKVTDRRTEVDWAEAMRELSDVYYPEAESIVVVLDNLNIYSPLCSMKLSNRKRPIVWPIALSSITPRNMAVGSTWPKLNLVL